MSKKYSPADEAFADCIKEASDHTCAKCEIQIEGAMQCSHIYSRSNRCIRWTKENAVSKCPECHIWWHSNIKDGLKWFIKKYGQSKLDYLNMLLQMRLKIYKTEEKEIAKHYREQTKMIKKKRLNGQSGYIDFVSYDDL